MNMNIGELVFNVKNVAIIGASRDPRKLGFRVIDGMIRSGFKGNIYPVNPKYKSILGFKCYPNVSSIPETLDLAAIVTPAHYTPKLVEECGRSNVRIVTVLSSGFSETSNLELEKELLAARAKYKVRIIGP